MKKNSMNFSEKNNNIFYNFNLIVIYLVKKNVIKILNLFKEEEEEKKLISHRIGRVYKKSKKTKRLFRKVRFPIKIKSLNLKTSFIC